MSAITVSALNPRVPGHTHISDASGFEGRAEALFVPKDESEAIAVIKAASESNTPLTILGAGSGLTGARVAQGGWVVSLENFRKLEVQKGHARAGAAITLVELNAAAQATGQFYAPDPTENTASIGGTIGTNASGSKSFRFGSTRRHVLAVKVATMDGRVREYRRGEPVDFPIPEIPLPRSVKSTAGYPLRPGMDWIDLFCGSEGTLGIVLEAELQLLPLPESLFAGVIFFPDDDAALAAVDNWRPVVGLRMIEYFDRASLNVLLERYPEIPSAAGAALLIESDANDVEEWAERLEAAHALTETSWFAVSAADRERFRRLRHTLPELVNATMARRGFMKMGTDFAVPLDRNREMLRYYRGRLERELPGHYVVYGHIGEAHVHVNMLPATQEGYETADRLMTEFARKAAELGGTVSAEHGLGKRKAHFLEIQYAPEHIKAMMDIKRRLDPQWLLGRGTLFPIK
jgi:FAD/FMN-containing dehydrogenase